MRSFYQKKIEDNSKQEINKNKSHKSSDGLGTFLKVLGFSSILMSFFAYFVSVGIAESVGRSNELLISGSYDIFYFAEIGTINSVPKLISLINFQTLIDICWSNISILLFYTVIFGVVVFFAFPFKVEQSTLKFDRVISEFFSKPKSNKNHENICFRKTAIFFRILTSIIAYPFLFIFGYFTVIFFIMLIFVLLSIPALLGFSAGKNYVNEVMSDSVQCFPSSMLPTSTNQHKKKAKANYVNCIQISWDKPENVIYRGKVIALTNSYAFLYNPSQGVQKITINNKTIIQSIDLLDIVKK